jgi:hypothetical protein
MSQAPLFDKQPMRDEETVADLRAHGIFMDLKANIEIALDEVIKQVSAGVLDRKLFKKHRRVLLCSGNFDVILFIWKESRFVSEDAAIIAGLNRKFSGKIITAHNLAAEFSESPREVGRMNSKMRSIGLAAEYFGLLERRIQLGKAVELRATELLDCLMKRIAALNLLDVVKFCEWQPVSNDRSFHV